ncbi:MAG: hypothetical protein QXW19_05505 [Candidatus Bathyarchaeia archaeon]
MNHLPLLVLIFLIPRVPLLPHAPKGVDSFFHLLAARRFEKGFPKKLDAFIIGDDYAYPPLFHLLLSLVPEEFREMAPLLLGVASELGSLILLYALSSALFGEAVAALSALAYSFTPVNYAESIWQTPRPLGIFLYNLSMALLLLAPPSARPLAALSIALLLLTHRLSAQALWLSSALLLPLLVGGDPPAIAWIPLGFALALAISKGSYLRILRDHLEHIRFHLRYGEMGRGRKRPGNPLDLAKLNPFAAIPFLGLMTHPGLLGDPLLWWLAAALALFFAWIWGDGHRYLAFASFPASILIARLSLLQSPAILIATPLAFALSARKVYWIARSFADWPSYSPLKALGIPRSSRAFTPDALNYALPYYTGCKALCGPGSEALYFWRERLYPLTKERLRAVADEYGLTHMLIPKGEAGKVPEGFIRRGEALGHLLFERAGPAGKARQWLDADERDLAGMASNNHSAIKKGKGIFLGRFISSTKLARAKWPRSWRIRSARRS